MFDLERALKEGCLAGDRPARIICTDRKGASGFVVLVDCGDTEEAHTYFTTGNKCAFTANPKIDLRNLPEEKTVEVTLWQDEDNAKLFYVTLPDDSPGDGWTPYGPPQKVTFPKGE